MILIGNQRGGGRDLALHLMKDENDHVTLHELRGFSGESLREAFNEAYALSRATRCTQYLFSLSLNPPPGVSVSTETFESTIDRIEERLGLSGQPRAIVFHEKDGRRHAHAVWSRIDTEKLKAVPLPYTKQKMQEMARELFIEHGWQMPHGLVVSGEADPRNFTLAEWQQAKRAGKDPKAIKAAFQDSWAISDSGPAFAQALKARGYTLAQGDRRGYVALDLKGEVYAVAKWVGVKTKDVKARLGPPESLPTIEQAKAQIAREMTETLSRIRTEEEKKQQAVEELLAKQRATLVQRQREERATLQQAQEARRAAELKIRQARFRTGLRGLWDRVTGAHARIKAQIEREALASYYRDRTERDAIVFRQLDERRQLAQRGQAQRARFVAVQAEIEADTANLQPAMAAPQSAPKSEPRVMLSAGARAAKSPTPAERLDRLRRPRMPRTRKNKQAKADQEPEVD